jgi:hypothetical protein
MKLVIYIKMCLNESYTEVRVGITFLIQFLLRMDPEKVNSLSPTLLRFALEYANRRVQAEQEGLK